MFGHLIVYMLCHKTTEFHFTPDLDQKHFVNLHFLKVEYNVVETAEHKVFLYS